MEILKLALRLLLLALPAAVQAQFSYTTNNSAITITGYTGPGGAVVIPSTINGLPVTSIGGSAFYYCVSLLSVTIPDSVTNLGGGAFALCTSLTNVTIPENSITSIGWLTFEDCYSLNSFTVPNSVTSIGSEVFFGCRSLTNVIIGRSVSNIEEYAFYDCGSLTGITVDVLNSFYSSLDGVLFNKNQTALIQCPGRKVGSYKIPKSVTSIGDWAFESCGELSSIIIPSSVTSIGKGAFVFCGKLNSIIIPNSVSTLPDYALEACQNLTNVLIGASVNNIGNLAFYHCRSLVGVTIPNGVTNIGYQAFGSCGKLSNITIPDSVNSIGYGAFEDCTNLRGIYFCGNAPSANSTVFSFDCNATVYYLAVSTGWGSTFAGRPAVLWNPLVPYSYMTNNGAITITAYIGPGGEVTIPSTINCLPVAGIGRSAFYSCTDLNSVRIPDGVTNIGDAAFQFCTGLTRVQVPDSVTSIGNNAFYDCTSLTHFRIGNNVTNIGNNAFYDCSSLTSITVGSLNRFYSSLDGVLFDKHQTTLIECPAGKAGTYVVPNGVKNIDSSAFSYCSGLDTIKIPNSVIGIGSYAFSSCTSLTAVYFLGNAPSADSSVFASDNNATVYYLPRTIGWGSTFGGSPTAPWQLQVNTGDRGFGVQSNQFGFNINWASGQVVVVEVCADLANPVWLPLQTNTLAGGSIYFSDPDWANYPARFYRISSP